MFGKFIKNKVLCFLLTTAALCPSKEAKSASDIVMDEKMEDASAETVEVDGISFYISPSEETTSENEVKEVPLSTEEVQEVKVEGVPFLIEKVDDESDKSSVNPSRAELDELLTESESVDQSVELPSQSVETVTLSKEEKQKIAEDMQGLLNRLNSGDVDSKPKITPDLTGILALTGDSQENKPSQQEEKAKTTEEVVEEPLSSIQPAKVIHPDDSLASLQNLDEDIEGKSKSDVKPVVVAKVERKLSTFQNPSEITSKDKKQIAIVGGITLTGLLLAAAGIMLSAPSSKPLKKRRKKKASSQSFRNDPIAIREIINNVIQSPQSKLKLTEDKSERKVEQKETVPAKDVTDQKVTETVSSVSPESKKEDVKPVSDTVAKPVDDPKQNPENSVTLTNKDAEAPAPASDKKEVSEVYSADFSDILLSKNSHELFQWLCAVKAIYDIQKERAVLKREMARAKKLDNQEEQDRINARRKILNAKRRAACLQANSREMQAIKDLRRQLTKKMTLAKRGKNMDDATREAIKEEVMATRWSLRQRVKEMNGQIKAFDYSKQWRSFLGKYKQSRQAA